MNRQKVEFSRVMTISFWILFLMGSCSRQPQATPSESELVAAVMARQAAVADSLLEAGAPPNSKDEDGTPVLILAVNEGMNDLAKELVERGAKINARREAYFRSTALMEVGVRNDPILAAWLLDHGADIHMRDSLGDTPLNWASFYGHKELAALYLQRGADWNVTGKQGNAVEIALYRGHQDLVDFYIEEGAGERLGTEEKAFITAVRDNDTETVKKAVRGGIDPGQTDEVGTPALILAATYGNEDVLKELLSLGADKDAFNGVGETAMARAARYGHRHIVELLLAADADPELAGRPFLVTPIIAAAQAGKVTIIRMLLAAGVDPNEQEGINGFTPLMLATAGGHVEAVKTLLAAGGSPYIKGFEGAGLYDMLRYSNNPEIGAVIRQALLEDE